MARKLLLLVYSFLGGTMKTKKKNYGRQLFIVVTVVLVAIFALGVYGCKLPELNKGSLHITINAGGAGWRPLLPGTDMVPAHYRIEGTGPLGATFEKITDGSYFEGTGLDTGEWKVSVTALNAGGSEIGYGENTVIIEEGKLSSITVDVRPFTGTGDLSLAVSWPVDEVPDAVLQASLTGSTGAVQPLTFDAGAGTASYYGSSLSAGYYTLTLQIISSGGAVLGGIVDSVRIVQDSVTKGTYSFTDISHPVGNITIVVTVDMDDPLDVTISGAIPVLAYGENMTAAVSVSNAAGDTLTYTWYINGSPVGTGESVIAGADLRRGKYRLDVVVFTTDSSRSGSSAYSFTIE